MAATMGVIRRAGAAVRRRHAVVRADPERGYSVLEASITLPIVVFMLMFIVQWAIVWHSRSVAQAAAQEGLRSAEAYSSTAATGQSDARNFLQQTSPHAMNCSTVSVKRSQTTVTVHVRCSVMSVIPFGNYAVDETASGPVEGYVVTR